ncbi:tetratricopeptide repeat protein [Psychrobium sp. nBUS_13]|uniref:tetratricopeptide repeat protein n=1 Tax=Psychrobium sp. nBUS_13 TaxID=3395319 RepID=UPI003EBA89A5
MSVINRVLNDIEQRNEQEKSAQGYEPVQIKEPSSIGQWLVVLIVLVICFSGVSYWLMQQSENEEQASVAEVVVKQKKVPQDNIPNSDKPVVTQETKAIAEELVKNEKPSEAEDIRTPKVLGAEAKEVVSAVVQIHEKKPKEVVADLPIILEEKSNDIKARTNKEPVKQQKLSITPVKMSTTELAQLKLTQGLKAQKVGEIAKAQEHWQEALTLVPSLHDARVQLAASYFGENNVQKAIALLSYGNKKYETFDGYRLLAAQIYYQSNELDKALLTLSSPYLDSDASTENLTLAASIAQQLKRWPVAMANYQQLVNRQQNNPQWLLGLAIAQDAQQLTPKALQNYQQLLLFTRDQGIYNYAQQRISALQSELEQ